MMGDLKLNLPTMIGIRENTRLMIYKPRETSLFSHLPRVPPFASYDKAVQVKNAYGPNAISGGRAYGEQDKCGASKVLLMVNGESVVLSIFMKD